MIAQEVDTAMEGAPRKAKRTDSGIEEIVLRAVRKVTNRFWGKKPMVSLIVHRLEEE